MNQKQRKLLEDISARLSIIHEQLENMCEEEQSKYDNLPESLQSSSKADEYEEAINNLTEAAEAVQAAIDAVDLI